MGACSSGEPAGQSAVVIPERLQLRSSTAKVARSTGELRSGDRVTIVERTDDGGTNWVKLRGPGGQTGWVEARNVVSQEIVDRSRRLADEVREIQAQASGSTKATLKLRLTPDRSTEENVATTLPSGTMVEIVARERRPRPAPTDAKSATQPVANKEAEEQTIAKHDEWYKVRLKDNPLLPAGWIYAGSIELAVPPEISYYISTGRRIVGWQKIGTARDEQGRAGDHYLVLERSNSSGDDKVDFDRLKVLAYDPVRREHHTPFRDDVDGRFPLTFKMEGSRGSFQVQALDRQDNLQKLDYTIELIEGGKVRVTRATPKEPARGRRKR
jgi:hypothetical protein